MRLSYGMWKLVRLPRFSPRKGLLLALLSVSFLTLFTLMGTDEDVVTMKTQTVVDALQYLRTSIDASNNAYTSILLPSGLNMCKSNGSEHYFLFMFMTSPEKEEERNVIRQIIKENSEAWEKFILSRRPDYKIGEAVKVLFFVGQHEDLKLQELLINEWESHGDLIVDDFKETYLNLTLKTVRMLKWVQTHCSEVRYLVKVDDDVYFHVPKLVYFLESLNETASQNLVAGHKYLNTSIDADPNSKWYTPPSVWPGRFPDFVAGFFYVLGTNARAELYDALWNTPAFHMEDVFLTGMVRNRTKEPLEAVDIPLIYTYWHWASFSDFKPSCSLSKVIVVHSMPIKTVQCWTRKFSQMNFHCSSLWPIFTYCW